jgi:membrane-associated protease RseP (regulator of RpoE activity)
MRTLVLLLSLIAEASVATGIAAAAPPAQKSPDPSLTPDASDDVTAPAGRGRLGFAALEISPSLRAFLGAPADRGVLVDQLRPDSPAARAGVRTGDVILEVDAAPARSVNDIVEAISDRKSGDVVTVRAVRGKAPVSLQIKLDTDPGPRVEESSGGRWRQLGPDGATFDLKRFFGDPQLRGELDATRKRLEQLEQRIEKLERR